METFNIGIIGMGVIGKAIWYSFSGFEDYSIHIYDKYNDIFGSIEDTIKLSEYIFLCLPTPNFLDGKQDISNIIETIEKICTHCDNKDKIIIIKSSILPGTTRGLQQTYINHGFVFNPEFLTERTAIYDFMNQNRIILGGIGGSVQQIKKLYQHRFPHVPIYVTGWEEAELVKYMTNLFFVTKIAFCNEFYDICKEMKISYEHIKKLWLTDGRISNSHHYVPGPDGSRGFGGKCFPDNLDAFLTWCNDWSLSVDTLQAAKKVNKRVRNK
jgi:UDPglucose 6-dehydrogenase